MIVGIRSNIQDFMVKLLESYIELAMYHVLSLYSALKQPNFQS